MVALTFVSPRPTGLMAPEFPRVADLHAHPCLGFITRPFGARVLGICQSSRWAVEPRGGHSSGAKPIERLAALPRVLIVRWRHMMSPADGTGVLQQSDTVRDFLFQ